ncbi:MAG: class I SAM-dependent methyltransferase [Chloroflexota bacterium]
MPDAPREPSSAPQPFATFDLRAAHRYDAWYASPAGKQVAAAEEALLGELLGHFPGAGSLLEVGCGTGHFSRWFARQGLAVVGLDVGQAMLAVAGERAGGPHYAAGSALSLPFADGAFDLVAFVTCLEFIGERRRALQEAARVARRGIVLGLINQASPLGVWRKAKAHFRPSPYREACFYAPWGLAGLLKAALGERVQSVAWQTAVYPGWLPAPGRRLPIGAFLGVAVSLAPPGSRTPRTPSFPA